MTKQDISNVFDAETRMLRFYGGIIPPNWKKDDYLNAVINQMKLDGTYEGRKRKSPKALHAGKN